MPLRGPAYDRDRIQGCGGPADGVGVADGEQGSGRRQRGLRRGAGGGARGRRRGGSRIRLRISAFAGGQRQDRRRGRCAGDQRGAGPTSSRTTRAE